MKLNLKSTTSILMLAMSLTTPTIFAMEDNSFGMEGNVQKSTGRAKKLRKKQLSNLATPAAEASARDIRQDQPPKDGMPARIQRGLDNKFSKIAAQYHSTPIENPRVMEELLWNGGPGSDEGNRAFNITLEVLLRAHLIQDDLEVNTPNEAEAWISRAYTYLHTKFMPEKSGYYDINLDTKKNDSRLSSVDSSEA